jgi:membrane protease YdiL (CAAX protease family)
VVNNSISKPSALLPIGWPPDSFPPRRTTVLILLTVVPIILFGVYNAASASHAHIDASVLANPLVVIITLAATLGIEGAFWLALILSYRWATRISLREAGYTWPSLRSILVAIAGAIVMAIVANGSAALIQDLTHSQTDQVAVQMLGQLHDPRLLVSFALFACVFAPIMEETFFRALLFNAIRTRYGFWAGAVVSGLCFGLAHGEPAIIIPLALGGIVLAFVYSYTRNIVASMITHGLFNSFTVIAVIFFPNLAK